MTFTAVGASFGTQLGSNGTTFSLTPHTVGDFILCEVQNISGGVVKPTALSSSNVTWSALGASFAGTTNAMTAQVFFGIVTSTSAQTVTITFSGAAPSQTGIAGQEFSTTAGNASVTLDVQGHIDGAGTNTWASLTPGHGSGELYFGFSQNTSSASAGSTSGYTYNASVDGHSNGMAYNPACTSSVQAPVWGDSHQAFGIMVLVYEAASTAEAQVIQAPQQPARKQAQIPPQVITGTLATASSADSGTGTAGVAEITVIPVTEGSGHGSAAAAAGIPPALIAAPPSSSPRFQAKPQVITGPGSVSISSADSGTGAGGVTRITVIPVTQASGTGTGQAGSLDTGAVVTAVQAAPQPVLPKPPAQKPQVITGPPPAAAVIAFVQSASGTGTNVSTLTITLSSPTTAGNCLVVAAQGSDVSDNPHVTGITLGGLAGNFAALVSPVGTTATTAGIVDIWADPNCAGGQTSVVVTWSSVGTHEEEVFVYEFSGIAASGILDKSSTNFTTSTGATFTSNATAATTQAAELWFGAAGGYQTTITGPSSPWVNSSQLGSTSVRSLISGYKIVSAAGAATYSGTFSPNSFSEAGVVTLFGAAAPPPPASAQVSAAVLQPRKLAVPVAGPQVITGTLANASGAGTGTGAGGVTSIAVIPVTQASGHGTGQAGSLDTGAVVEAVQAAPQRPYAPFRAIPQVITGAGGPVHVTSADSGTGAGGVAEITVIPVTQASGHAAAAGTAFIITPGAVIAGPAWQAVPFTVPPQVITGPVPGMSSVSSAGTGTGTGAVKKIKPYSSGSGNGHGSLLSGISSTDTGHGTARVTAIQPQAAGTADGGSGAAQGTIRVSAAATASGTGQAGSLDTGAVVAAITGIPRTVRPFTAPPQVITGTITAPVSADSGTGTGGVTSITVIPAGASGHAAAAGTVTAGSAVVVTGPFWVAIHQAAPPQVITGISTGPVHVSSADAGRGTGSDFFFITGSGSGTGHGSPVSVRLSAKAAAQPAAGRALNAWPSAKAAGHGRGFAASAWPSGSAAGQGRGAVPMPWHWTGADSGSGTAAVPDIGIWTYLPPSWTERRGVIAHLADGRELVVAAADKPTGQLLELARRVSGALEVRHLTAGCTAGGDGAVTREPVSVTLWVTEAAVVSVWTESG